MAAQKELRRRFDEVFRAHEAEAAPQPVQDIDWGKVLAGADEQETAMLELIRDQVDGQPVRLWRTPAGGAVLEATLAWQAENPRRYAALAVFLHEDAREEVRRCLVPHLPEMN